MSSKEIKVAVVDLYDNHPNQGMRCIKELLKSANGATADIPVSFDVFETRYKGEAPDLSHDIYISSGGPGSPFDGEGSAWEASYFRLVDRIWNHNQHDTPQRKFIFFICHSIQMMSRFFQFAEIIERRSPAFGFFPVHKTEEGMDDPIFKTLPDPFWAADFRSWQLVQPRAHVLDQFGAKILQLEKIRDHVPYERAVMAIRITDEMLGTQYHPEADALSMNFYFRSAEAKERIIAEHGVEKYDNMIKHLDDPEEIMRTHDTVLPTFLRNAIHTLRADEVERALHHADTAL